MVSRILSETKLQDMLPKIRKIDPDKQVYYVLREGKKPGIYFSYEEALSHKHDGDERPVIRKFSKWCEAIFFSRTGEDLPPPLVEPEPYRKPLF